MSNPATPHGVDGEGRGKGGRGGRGGGAGGSALNREVQVASFRAPILVWVSVAVSLVSCLFHVIAFSAPDWARLPEVDGKLGLWQQCAPTGCGYFTLGSEQHAFRCVQTFALLALLLMFACLCLTAMIIYMSNMENLKRNELSLIVVHGATAFCLMIAFAVWSGEIINKARGASPGGGWTPGGSFGLEIVCFIFEIAAAAVLFLDYIRH